MVCFVSLSRWHEPPPINIDEKKSHTSIKGKGDKNEAEKELTNVTSSSVLDGKFNILVLVKHVQVIISICLQKSQFWI